jgi:hypothetical protein
LYLEELNICTPQLESLGDAPALGQFLDGHPAIIHLTVDGHPRLSSDIIQHTLAETVTLGRAPDASAVARLSPRVRTLEISMAPPKLEEQYLLAFLEALTNSQPREARLACVKLDFTADKDRMRSEILPFAHRLYEQGVVILDADNKNYHA